METLIKYALIKHILHRLSNKWAILILLILHSKDKIRFSELIRITPGISQRMLTLTLRTLEEDQLISRVVHPDIPPKVEYQLTSIGLSLIPHIETLIHWAQLYNDEHINYNDTDQSYLSADPKKLLSMDKQKKV